jgi:hypothetical protein
VLGNVIEIPFGDTTPDVADGTDFGEVAMGATRTHMFSILNMGAGPLQLAAVYANFAPFFVERLSATNLLPGENATFDVLFDTAGLSPGQSILSAVQIESNDPDEGFFRFFIRGSVQTPVSHPGDMNGDGAVDRHDLALFVPGFATSSGGSPAAGDFNQDGRVNLVDLLMLKQGYTSSAASSAGAEGCWLSASERRARSIVANRRSEERGADRNGLVTARLRAIRQRPAGVASWD